MIQRIQTLYLLLAVIASVVAVFLPWTDLYNATTNTAYTMNFCGIFRQEVAEQIFQTNVWGMSIFTAGIPLLAFITILFYKKRKLQLSICYVNIILVACYCISYAFYIYTAITDWQVSVYPYFYVALPLVSLFFILLAIGGIKKDEKLIRSLDRLR